MRKFPYVLSEYDEINSPIYQPINSTHRIKYTCFHVSPGYLVLGSTSGSIYMFSRDPCSFLHLIPLSEGAVSCVLLSPDETLIALATVRGIVCLISLKPSPKLIAVSMERVNERVDCLCWNDDSSEVYVGDSDGKISVIVLSIFTVNGMFRAPSCTLMNLDSAIVQLSFSSPLLLVSTLTRCYVCDTVEERYRRVGNKTRNGEFGACFYETRLVRNGNTATAATAPKEAVRKEEKLIGRKRSFNFVPEDNNADARIENVPRIFCARPGSRLWEVSANGVVIETHQFKEALAVPPAKICRPNIPKSVRLQRSERIWTPQSLNFSPLCVIADKYLFSYTSSGLYVVDPLTATVVLWNDEFSDITMARVFRNKIYLMTSEGKFHCLTLFPLDTFILALYDRKKYRECLETCLVYEVRLKKLLDGAEIDEVCEATEDHSRMLTDDRLFALLRPLMLLLESDYRSTTRKLCSTGIVVVNSGNSRSKSAENFRCSSRCHESSRETESTTDSKMLPRSSIDSIDDESKETGDANRAAKCRVKEMSETEEEEEELDSNKNVMRKIRIDLRAMRLLVDAVRPSMNEEELEKAILDVNRRMNVIRDAYESLTFVYEILRSAELYYFNALLENTLIDLIRLTDNKRVLKQITTAFIGVNAENCERCTCGNPCPANEPKFLEVGRTLLRRFVDENKERCVSLCDRVPYLWRDYLPVYMEEPCDAPMNDLLSLCLRIKDTVALSVLLPLLDDQRWNLLATYVNRMYQGRCLFCSESIKNGNNEISIQWTAVIYEIMRKQGPDIATAVLRNLENAVPNVSIDKSIFQSLVFTKMLHKHGMKRAVNFGRTAAPELSEYRTVCSAKVRQPLIRVLEKDLGRSITQNVFGHGAYHWGMRYRNKFSACPCCTLSLRTPVLLGNDGIAIFRCGHAYHVNCMIEKKLTTCDLHS